MQLYADDQIMVAVDLLDTLRPEDVEAFVLDASTEGKRLEVRSCLAELRDRYKRVNEVRCVLGDSSPLGYASGSPTHESYYFSAGTHWQLAKDSDGIRTMILVNEDGAIASVRDRGSPPSQYLSHSSSTSSAPAAQSSDAPLDGDHSDRVYSIRLEGLVALDFFPILALFREADLFVEWMPYVLGLGLQGSEIIDQRTDADMVVKLDVCLPPPFSARDAVIRCQGHDCMTERDKTKQVVVLLDSISQAEESELIDRLLYKSTGEQMKSRWHKNSYKAGASDTVADYLLQKRSTEGGEPITSLSKPNVTRTFLRNSALVLTPIEGQAGQVYLQIIAHVVPDFAYLPESLVDLMMQSFGYMVVEQVRRAGQILEHAVYKDRYLDKNCMFYARLRNRLEESLPSEYQRMPPFQERRVIRGVNAEIGLKVRRGRDWAHGDEDQRVPFGIISHVDLQHGICTVVWKHMDAWTNLVGFMLEEISFDHYRIGVDDQYDLAIYFENEINFTG